MSLRGVVFVVLPGQQLQGNLTQGWGEPLSCQCTGHREKPLQRAFLVLPGSSVQFSRSVVSDCLRPHELQLNSHLTTVFSVFLPFAYDRTSLSFKTEQYLTVRHTYTPRSLTGSSVGGPTGLFCT